MISPFGRGGDSSAHHTNTCMALSLARSLRSKPIARAGIRSMAQFAYKSNLPAGKRHFLHVDDLSSAEFREVIDLAKKIKPILKGGPGLVGPEGRYERAKGEKPVTYKPFTDQTLPMIFVKPSARTRVSFETGWWMLGGHAFVLGDEIGIGKREATKDISRVLSNYNDMIMARLYKHEDMIELASHATVPVVNGLTDFNHPCQIMADALTIEEVLGSIEGKKVVYVGDGNNIVHSWLELAMIVPFEFVCACPPGYEPNADLVKRVQEKGVGKAEVIVGDPKGAVKGADAVYADVWASMQSKDEMEERIRVFKPYQVNEELMAATGKDNTMFLHCLPAERGKETTDGVMESKNSYIFQQAENRMHAQNAVMVWMSGAKRP
jgi:ornithine carbamoyltransferase